LIIEIYEKYLLNSDSSNEVNGISKVSYYLCELILYQVNLKLIQSNTMDAVKLMGAYLRRSEIGAKLDPNDLCVMWLCLIHLEAFKCLPVMIRSSLLNNRVLKYFTSKKFWRLDSNGKRTEFRQEFFRRLDAIYSISNRNNNKERLIDSFILPWHTSFTCSKENLQSLFYEALKSVNMRVSKQIQNALNNNRLISVPLFLNLICLEISNKRHEVAFKLCERLLKSNDAQMLKELWISQIYIQRSLLATSESNIISNSEETVKCALQMFQNDAQICFVAAQYYFDIGKQEECIRVIESLVPASFLNDNRCNSLQLYLSQVLFDEKEEESTQLVGYALCYCFYMQLKGTEASQTCQIYERIMKRFSIQTNRAVIWTKYFKYVSLVQLDSCIIFEMFKRCILDFQNQGQASINNDLIIPFHKISLLAYQSHQNDNYLKQRRGLIKSAGPYCFDRNDSNNEMINKYYHRFELKETEEKEEEEREEQTDNYEEDIENKEGCFYYLNCLIELWFKLFTKSLNDKYNLTRRLIQLVPHNLHLLRLLISFGCKINGAKHTLQLVHDHLQMHQVINENAWILCMKLCIDNSNDMQQALLLYQKGEQICRENKACIIGLQKLANALFSSSSNVDNTSEVTSK